MSEWWWLMLFLILIAGQAVSGNSLQSDKEALLQLKTFLQDNNRYYRGRYMGWNNNSSPCVWSGITCSDNDSRVIGIDLSNSNISGKMFDNFSHVTELSKLDLSKNTIGGSIHHYLNSCKNLRYLNLSENILEGELNLTALTRLETLDITNNRFYGGIRFNFPALCNNLVTLNISENNFTGRIDDCFDECLKLQNLDLSENNFTGKVWLGLQRLVEFSASKNNLTGEIPGSIFTENCTLQFLDLSRNDFNGSIPKEVSKCKHLYFLNLEDNRFSGVTPSEIGSLPNLETLILGKNLISKEIPESLLNLSNLAFLDYDRNYFGGEIQVIFGKFVRLQYLILNGNNYTGGLITSGVLKLPKLVRLDLSHNHFTGPLPVEFSGMPKLRYLFLAFNQFNGSIPLEFGNFSAIQALDFSSNRLTGRIPPTIGKLSSLLWLMLANNSLTGEIPHEIGNCSSLLWLNLANNQLSGTIPSEISNIAKNPTPTFESNRGGRSRVPFSSGQCISMKRWIPAVYPPFNFVYSQLTMKKCRRIWDSLLKGYGMFPICTANSSVRTLQISGYIQLTGNHFSGKLPPEIARLQNFSLLHVGINNFSGEFSREIANMPLMVLNVSYNGFSGEIPSEIGNIHCLEQLDLSHNNFSGEFPTSLNKLTELSKFNVSYNPLISGVVPSTGQLTTFENNSFIGDPLLILPDFMYGNNNKANHNKHSCNSSKTNHTHHSSRKQKKSTILIVFLALTPALLVCGVVLLTMCIASNTLLNPSTTSPLEGLDLSSADSSPKAMHYVNVIHKKAFTYDHLMTATGNFSSKRIIGHGGFGTVYRGVLPDGREVAVKKLAREGLEGKKEFKAEMEALGCNGCDWPHPNLVTLYGWCVHGKENMLVYEYVDGGSLEELITDRTRLTWQMRIKVATDVARALVYLHHECFPPILHRDMKASNVLLDKRGRVFVTDFGLARLVDTGKGHVSTMVAGTVGYVAPEYWNTWQATTNGDVYSFGVLAMELATARWAIDEGDECLVDWARRVVGHGNGDDDGLEWNVLVPLGFRTGEGAKEMLELLRVGMRCIGDAPQERPNMKEVLGMLVKLGKN